jgi:hypothetical protein
MLMYFFACLFWISPRVWLNSGFWCCVTLIAEEYRDARVSNRREKALNQRTAGSGSLKKLKESTGCMHVVTKKIRSLDRFFDFKNQGIWEPKGKWKYTRFDIRHVSVAGTQRKGKGLPTRLTDVFRDVYHVLNPESELHAYGFQPSCITTIGIISSFWSWSWNKNLEPLPQSNLLVEASSGR